MVIGVDKIDKKLELCNFCLKVDTKIKIWILISMFQFIDIVLIDIFVIKFIKKKLFKLIIKLFNNKL